VKKLTPDRAALAEAIERVNAVYKHIDEATAAEKNAQLRLSAAYEREELLNASLLEYAEPSPDQLISHLAAGGDVEVRDGEQDLRDKLSEVGKEIEKWRGLRDLARGEVAERKDTLLAAQRKAIEAADAVMVATIDVDALVAETADLQARVINNRVKLAFVSSMIDGPDRDRVKDFLRVAWLRHGESHLHPATQDMRAFRDALTRDPNAPAPGAAK
jgi:uncharacterized protein YlzI (FlbEa/FlbD family)